MNKIENILKGKVIMVKNYCLNHPEMTEEEMLEESIETCFIELNQKMEDIIFEASGISSEEWSIKSDEYVEKYSHLITYKLIK